MFCCSFQGTYQNLELFHRSTDQKFLTTHIININANVSMYILKKV